MYIYIYVYIYIYIYMYIFSQCVSTPLFNICTKQSHSEHRPPKLNMNIFISICKHRYVYIISFMPSEYIFAYTYIYIYICLYVYLEKEIHIYKHAHMYLYTYILGQTCGNIWIYLHVYACIHIHIYINLCIRHICMYFSVNV